MFTRERMGWWRWVQTNCTWGRTTCHQPGAFSLPLEGVRNTMEKKSATLSLTDSMGSTVPDLVKRLTDKIVGAVNELVLLHHDLYTHPGKAHSLSVERCGVCRELEEAIQVGVDATFSRGVVVGKKSGVATIR